MDLVHSARLCKAANGASVTNRATSLFSTLGGPKHLIACVDILVVLQVLEKQYTGWYPERWSI